MAHKTALELPLADPLTGDEVVAIVQEGNSRQATASEVAGAPHVHAIDDVTGLQDALDDKIDDDQIDTDVTLAANSDDLLASQKAVKAFITAAIAAAVTGLLDDKGDLDCSANPNYPAASKGDAYHVTVAGRIGGGAGPQVEIGDVIAAKADNAGGTHDAVGASWYILEHNLVGAAIAGLITASGLTMNTGKILGRTTAAAGGIEEITPSTGLSFAAGLLAVLFSSAAEIRTGTEAAKAMAPDQLIAAAAQQVLGDAANIAWNMANGFNAKVTITANRTLDTPTNPKAGVTYALEVIQGAGGTHTMTWPASFNWGLAGAPVLSTAVDKNDIVFLYCIDAATPKFRASCNKDG